VDLYKKVILPSKVKGFPKMLANGTETKAGKDVRERKFIAISKHGFDLKILLKMCGEKFSFKTSL
jgi:hypothetical protein